MGKRCCFAGHSRLYSTDEIYNKLINLIEDLIIKEKVTEFFVGNYGCFDRLSARAVKSLKERHPSITLSLVIPYLTAEINQYKEDYYQKYDCLLIADIPENTPKKFHILKCNEYMVKNSDFLICYVDKTWGGASKTQDYALKKNKRIFNIASI